MDRAAANYDAAILSIAAHLIAPYKEVSFYLLIKIRSEAGNNDDFYFGDCRNNSASCQGITLETD